ncbi:hypothetical protein [Spirillospora sp. CA-294931]|uniref:hypothetical protein n=1 Tax=Spirillospora sp. CA-294931 TaxID=3240042 RepID=UPI003D8DECF4
MSNGGTDVFFDVITLAGCALAATPWQQNLVLHFADGHRLGRGVSGFDLSELPWTDWPAQKLFLLKTLDKAAARHGWERLDYEPPFALAYLRSYLFMVEGLAHPLPGERDERLGNWDDAPAPEHVALCPTHHVYEGHYGCRFCSDW